MARAKVIEFKIEKRRTHHHYLVTVTYSDGDLFGRIFTNLEKAKKFAARQTKSAKVQSARIQKLS